MPWKQVEIQFDKCFATTKKPKPKNVVFHLHFVWRCAMVPLVRVRFETKISDNFMFSTKFAQNENDYMYISVSLVFFALSFDRKWNIDGNGPNRIYIQLRVRSSIVQCQRQRRLHKISIKFVMSNWSVPPDDNAEPKRKFLVFSVEIKTHLWSSDRKGKYSSLSWPGASTRNATHFSFESTTNDYLFRQNFRKKLFYLHASNSCMCLWIGGWEQGTGVEGEGQRK